jgi:hypothetical protein
MQTQQQPESDLIIQFQHNGDVGTRLLFEFCGNSASDQDSCTIKSIDEHHARNVIASMFHTSFDQLTVTIKCNCNQLLDKTPISDLNPFRTLVYRAYRLQKPEEAIVFDVQVIQPSVSLASSQIESPSQGQSHSMHTPASLQKSTSGMHGRSQKLAPPSAKLGNLRCQGFFESEIPSPLPGLPSSRRRRGEDDEYEPEQDIDDDDLSESSVPRFYTPLFLIIHLETNSL